MRHHNSVFHAVLKHMPWSVFEKLVEKHGADARVRRLPTKSQFVALLYAQLADAGSLRAIEEAMASHRVGLYHLGVVAPKRSTLSDANANRPADLFADLFAALLAKAQGGLRRRMAETTYLIDSTGLRLDLRSAGWARFSAKVAGAKLHVVYDADAERPIYAAVTPAKVNDITAAKAMPIEPGATYVFDLGYYDYAWWAKLDAAGCRIVTRFKTDTPLDVVESRPVLEAGGILSDRIGFLPKRQTKSRRNPMGYAVREVRVATDTGKILRILSNDLDADAREIADLYKRRWAEPTRGPRPRSGMGWLAEGIELFFRWIKQTLKIKSFIGTSQNAVRIQIAVALIAFLLLRLAQATQHAVKSPLAFVRLVRSNLMHRRHLHHLIEPDEPRPKDPNQASFSWA